MTKAELIKAIQKFPDETPLRLKIEDQTFNLGAVEWSVDASPQTVDHTLDTWQQAVAGRIRLDLVAARPKPAQPEKVVPMASEAPQKGQHEADRSPVESARR